MMELLRISNYGFTILQIETQASCNMNCAFCAYSIRKDKTSVLLERHVYEVIDSLDSSDPLLEYICLSHYNEPLLDKRIYDFIEYAKGKGFKVMIITNGKMLYNNRIANKLLESNPDYIKISLQLFDSKSFYKYRDKNFSFDWYVSGIMEFLKLACSSKSTSKITVDFACNFLTSKSWIIKTILGLERGDSSVPNFKSTTVSQVLSFTRTLRKYGLDVDTDKQRVKKILGEMDTNYLQPRELAITPNIDIKIKPFIYGHRLTKFYETGGIAKGCGTRILGVLASGEVVPCCLDYDGIQAIGNIKNDTLPNILFNSEDFIHNLITGKCFPTICRRCKGEPTKRGALYRKLIRS